MRGPRVPGPAILLLAIFAIFLLAISNIQAVPVYQTQRRTITQTLLPQTSGPGKKAPGAGPGTITTVSGPGAVVGASCAAGRSAGATDTGVTANEVKLGATMVKSGVGKSFLAGAPVAMRAVVDRVNRAGGVCGRLLRLKLIDDGWEPGRGVTYLRSLIDEGVFALPVSPSSEGVNQLITAGDLRTGRVPLVGADGMVKSMYTDPWVWPVATSTVSTMHIIVQDAYRRGARTFGVVFAKDYRFGVEGAVAFNTAVRKVTGAAVPGFNPGLGTCDGTFCGILSGQGQYGTEAEKFKSNCQKNHASAAWGHNGAPGSLPSCDVVAMLLEPKTALQWLQSGGPHPQGGAQETRMMGPQPLFNADFAKSCGDKCSDMVVWTSYNPPLDPFRTAPAVRQYVSTVRLADPSIDVANQFTEGAYLGMLVFVEALRLAGANLTRGALKRVLDTHVFDLGLGPALSWVGDHLGHGSMQSYRLRYNGQNFVGFQHEGGFVKDRLLGRDL